MTSDERKWGLRQAVKAKLQGNDLYQGREISLLWDIIDSLVDQIEKLMRLEATANAPTRNRG